MFISSQQGSLPRRFSGREAEIRAVTLWPCPMGNFSSFTSSSLGDGAAGLKGCNSRRKDQEKGPRMGMLFLHLARTQGPVRRTGLEEVGKDAGKRQRSSREEAEREKK